MRIMQRKEATEKGLKYYYTGKPCKHGHYSKRFTNSRKCCECNKENGKKWRSSHPSTYKDWYKKNRERKIAYNKKWAEDNKERVAALSKIWRQENSERFKILYRLWAKNNIEARKEIDKKWNENNPGRKQELNRLWRGNNKERDQENHRNARKRNPIIYRVLDANRRARLLNAIGTHTGKDIIELLQEQEYKCVYCNKDLRIEYHVDHIIALANGGGNSKSNLQILCPHCNMSKGAKDPIEFAELIEAI